MLRRLAPLVLSAVLAATATLTAGAADEGHDLYVDRAAVSCSDSYDRLAASSPETPWCSVVRAAVGVVPGDVVHIAPGRYPGVVRPASGSGDAVVRFVADGGGVVIDAAGADSGVKLIGSTDVVLDRLEITGASAQGVWVDGARNVVLDRVTVQGNAGHGVQVVRSSALTIENSDIRDNGGAGIFEGTATTGGSYVGNRVTANGLGAALYNGDGIQLGGAGAYVARNTITANGTPGPFEHGIYAGPSARGYVIESNVVSGNAGSNIKAAGGDGVIRYNRLEGGRLGLVFSDNATPVSAYYNLIFGSYQHAVFLTDGETAAQAKVWNNTIVVTSRSSSSGDASAVFVKAATLLDLRNNLVSYANEDNLGSAVYVVDSARLSKLVSNNNWFSTRDGSGRYFVRNGTRMALSAWRKATGQDAKSIVSAPPAIGTDARVTSKNLGVDRGQSVGLTRDYAGRPIRNAPDISAYEA